MGKKRREPENVIPVESNGTRYEAPLQGALFGYAQDGGIIVARNVMSRELEWTQRIYKNSYNEDMEDDKQDIFITSMALIKNGNYLLITNEHGKRYELNLTLRVAESVD